MDELQQGESDELCIVLLSGVGVGAMAADRWSFAAAVQRVLGTVAARTDQQQRGLIAQ